MCSAYFIILSHYLAISAKSPSDYLMPFIFYAFSIAFASFAGLTGEGVLWFILLFSSVTAGQNFFEKDYREGILKLYISKKLLIPYFFAKIKATAILSYLPLIIFSFIAHEMLGIDKETAYLSVLHIFIASISFIFLGALTSALSLGSRQNMYFITLPLYVPIIIFGANADKAENMNEPVLLLSGIALIISPLATFLGIYSLRNSVSG